MGDIFFNEKFSNFFRTFFEKTQYLVSEEVFLK